MSIKLQHSSKKDGRQADFRGKSTRYTISLGLGCILGLSIFLMATSTYTWSYSGAEVKSLVADCETSVNEYIPLGGSKQVISALNYCGTLGPDDLESLNKLVWS